jgi:hypothetical protein
MIKKFYILFLFILLNNIIIAQKKELNFDINFGISYLNLDLKSSSNLNLLIGFTINNIYFDIGSNFSIGKNKTYNQNKTFTYILNLGYVYYYDKNIYFIPTIGFTGKNNIIEYPNYSWYDKSKFNLNLGINYVHLLNNNYGFLIGIGNIQLIKLSFYYNY